LVVATTSPKSAEAVGFPCIPIRCGRSRSWRATEPFGPAIRSYCGGHLKANSVELGFEGCSSQSGRRSFITVAARNIYRSGCSLRDVQLLAGHCSIETTERYVDGDT
jgi:integrase